MMETTALYQRSIISINDIAITELWQIIQLAQGLKETGESPGSLTGQIVAHAFFEPSTRTRLSFEAATLRLGGQVIGFADPSTSSAKNRSDARRW